MKYEPLIVTIQIKLKTILYFRAEQVILIHILWLWGDKQSSYNNKKNSQLIDAQVKREKERERCTITWPHQPQPADSGKQ